MAKVIFEFDKNAPEDSFSLTNCYQADRLLCVIEDFSNFLRNAIKYQNPDLGYDYETLEKIQEDFNNCIQKHSIVLE